MEYSVSCHYSKCDDVTEKGNSVMCLSILSEKLVNLELLGEYIYISFDNGRIVTKELYDLFFSISCDWKEPRFICISPHFLLSDGKLNVYSFGAPGSGGPYDVVYERPVGFGSTYSAEEHTFSIKTYDVRDLKTPQIISVSGKVVEPKEIIVDSKLKDSSLAVEVMSLCGTVFELCLPELKANVIYAMRLMIEPAILVGLPEPRNLDEVAYESIRPYWIQDATVSCPKNCKFDFVQLLQKTREELPDLTETVHFIESKVVDKRLTIASSRRNRIVLIWPAGCELHRNVCQGSIMPHGSPKAIGENIYQEYYGGSDEFWIDDIFSLSRGIWEYLSEWAKAEPKSKEFITTALRVQHANCSLIVDKMADKKIIDLIDVNKGLYQACQATEEKVNSALEEIAMDSDILDKFDWTGYRILFAINYAYLSEHDRIKLDLTKRRPVIAYWLAIISIVLAIIGIVMGIFALILSVIK